MSRSLAIVCFALASLLSALSPACAYTRFPAGSCKPPSCSSPSSSPYVLAPSFSDNLMCFTVLPNSCISPDTGVDCCTALRRTFQKVAIKTVDVCSGSVDLVSINGVRKGGGIYFRNYTGFAEIVVTSIKSNYDSILGSVFCIHLTPPCNTPFKLCGNNSVCTYSIYEPFTHACCPTCDFVSSPVSDTTLYPPPNTPTHPSPVDMMYPPPNTPTHPSPVDMMYPPPEHPPPSTFDMTLSPPPKPHPPSPVDMTLSPPPKTPPPSPVDMMSPQPKTPPPPVPDPSLDSSSDLRVIIKAPVLDSVFVSLLLCPRLSSVFRSAPCSVVFESSTGVYYGLSAPAPFFTMEDILMIVQSGGIDAFTLDAGLICGSTILVRSSDRTVRYLSSRNTCIEFS